MALVPGIATAHALDVLVAPAAAAGMTTTTLTYSYDDNGNLRAPQRRDAHRHLHSTTTRTAWWRRRSRSAATPGTVTYTYDADGMRTSATAGGAPRTYLVDKNARPAAGAASRRRAPTTVDLHVRRSSLRQPDADRTPGTRFHLARRAALDPAARERGRRGDRHLYLRRLRRAARVHRHDAQRCTATRASSSTRTSASTTYARATTRRRPGRFITTDPETGSIFDPVSLHRYLYANADPVNNADPTGRFSFAFSFSQIALFSIAGAIIGAIYGFATTAGTTGNRIKGALFGAFIGYIIVFALLAIVSFVASYIAAQSAAALAAAEAELAAGEASTIVSANSSAVAETARELGFSAIRSTFNKFVTTTGRQAFINAMKAEIREAAISNTNASVLKVLQQMRAVVETLVP